MLVDIGKVAQRTGLAPSALRFYERRGLIQSCARRGLRRLYDEVALDRLALIVSAQRVGFTLAEIEVVLHLQPKDAQLRQQLSLKVDELGERIVELQYMQRLLRHTVRCTSPSLLACPAFRRGVRALQRPKPGEQPETTPALATVPGKRKRRP